MCVYNINFTEGWYIFNPLRNLSQDRQFLFIQSNDFLYIPLLESADMVDSVVHYSGLPLQSRESQEWLRPAREVCGNT